MDDDNVGKDIRKGIRLRPTQTVDKSRPMIKAEGESLGDYKPRGPDQSQADPPAPLYCPPPPPPSAPAPLKSPCRPPPNGPPSAPPPPPIAASNKPMDENQRQKLLAQIRGGVRLRHVQTVDKSGLVLDEQEKQQLLRATTPNGSLDSQGKSPSPSMASSSSMLSPSPPGGPIWPCSDSPSSDHFAPSPRNCSPSPSTRLWPEVLTEKQKMEINGKKQSDFQFDEQKQIEERQKEVAALTGRGGAQSRIAAFQQFQGRAVAPQPQKCPQPHQKAAAAFCTLPRAQKLGAAGGAKMENGKAANGGAKVNGGPQQNGQNGGPRQNGQIGQRPAAQQNGQIQSENNLKRSNSSSLQFAHPPPPSQFAPSALHVPPPQPQYFPPAAPSIATAPSPSTASAPPPFFRSYTPRIGQSAGGAHRQNFERIRGRFADGNGKEEEGEEKGAVALWKEAARQRKGQMNGQKSPIPPPLPNCPPPPLLQNGQQIPDWDTLREQFKFAVDLDGGPEGTKLIRIVRR